MTTSNQEPFFSIITVTLNDADNLVKTIQSIEQQTCNDSELIIVDGKSKDETIEHIKRYESIIKKWVSEKDNGIYQAMNKGLKLATGKYILFLNSGDTFASNQTLSIVKQNIESTESDIYYTNYLINDKKIDQKVSLWQLNRKMICHQTIFYSNKFINFNCFDEKMRYAADYDQLLRKYRNLKHKKINIYSVNYDPSGISSNKQNYGKIWHERAQGLRRADINPFWKAFMLSYALIATYFRSK